MESGYGGTDYLGRRKPFDEYAFEIVQDSYERKLTSLIDERGQTQKPTTKEHMRNLICSDRRGNSYFKRTKKR